MTDAATTGINDQRMAILQGVVTTLLDDLKKGNGDKDRRRQVEEWMRTLAERRAFSFLRYPRSAMRRS